MLDISMISITSILVVNFLAASIFKAMFASKAFLDVTNVSINKSPAVDKPQE